MSLPADAITRLRFDEQPERLPPHNVEAEEAVLGSVMLDREVITVLAEIIEQRDFYRERNGTIYQAMLDLYNRHEPVDFLTLHDELERSQKLGQVGGVTYLTSLLGVVPTPIHAEHYARIVASAAFMRRMIQAGGRIATVGFQNQCDPETALQRAEHLLAEVPSKRGGTGGVWNRDGIPDWYDEIQAIASGDVTTSRIPTGFSDLDMLLNGGLRRSDLVILAARPAMGKSALCQAFAQNAATRWRAGVALYSLEMTRSQLYSRMVASEGGLDLSRLQRGQVNENESRRLSHALGLVIEAPIAIDETPGLSVAAIRSRVRRLSQERPIDLVIVDHLQLIAGSDRYRGNAVQEMREISGGLKALAKEENVPVLALSQLSRAVEQRQSKVPMLSDLRESGSIEQDADVVMAIYRDDYYDQASERQGVAEIHVLKHRNGPTGRVDLLFNQRSTKFLPTEERAQERYWTT
jgi:replicative DNA helicase